MNRTGAILTDMSRLLGFFGPHCADRQTLDWLLTACDDRGRWPKAHGVHGQIRAKGLKAIGRGDAALAAQYRFEEMCAKTLYNLSRSPAPFDVDSPYWVIPDALVFGRLAGLQDADVLACVTLVPSANLPPAPPSHATIDP